MFGEPLPACEAPLLDDDFEPTGEICGPRYMRRAIVRVTNLHTGKTLNLCAACWDNAEIHVALKLG